MALFRKSSADAGSTRPASDDASESGKGRATPSRKQAEAERKERLKASATGATTSRASAAGARRDTRAEMRKRAAAGDERALAARDRGPERRFVRDIVDARYNVGEYVLYLAVLAFLSALIKVPGLAFASQIIIYFVVLAVIVDSMLLRRRVLREVSAKFPDSDNLHRIGRYAIVRALNIRRLRVPAPRVPRGKPGRRGGARA